MKKLKVFSLLIISLLFFTKCQEEEILDNNLPTNESELIINKITLKELTSKNRLTNSLELLNSKFDVNKQQRNIDANDGSFTLLTNEILETTKDSITTYTFLLKNNTDINSEFENFVIEVSDNEVNYIICKYSYNENYTDNFPYDISFQSVNENEIELEDFLQNRYLSYIRGCLYDIQVDDNGNVWAEKIWCSYGGGGNDGVFYNGYGPSDTGSGGDSSNTTNGENIHNVNTVDSNENTNNGSGASSSSAISVIKKEDYDQIISNCLNISDNSQQGSGSNTSNCSYIDLSHGNKKGLANFLEDNCGNQDASDFAHQAIETLCNNSDLSFNELLEIEDDCNKIQSFLDDPDISTKIDYLKTKTNLEHETGFEQNNSGLFTELQPTNGGTSLDINLTPSSVGYLHTHTDDWETSELDENGNPYINEVVRIFSPSDVLAYLKIYRNATTTSTINAEDTYAFMISSFGSYTLRFEGNINNVNFIYTEQEKKELNDKFREDVKKKGKERAFLLFVRNKMNIEGLSLFKIKNNGQIQEKSLKPNDRVQKTPCV